MTPMSPSNHSPRPLPLPWDIILPIAIRVFVWALLFTILYLLRSFFLLVFFTFVFSYLQNSAIEYIKRFLPNRTLRVILVAACMLGTLTSVFIFVVPKVKSQAEFFVSQFGSYIYRADQELLRLSDKHPLLKEILPKPKSGSASLSESTDNKLKNSPIMLVLQQVTGFGGEGVVLEKVNEIVDTLGKIGGIVASVTSAFLLSLLFSFLIVLDLPRLRDAVVGLEQTKLRFIYLEVAENIKEFGVMMGKALEAQFVIAVLNSSFTAVGISLLGLGKSVAFLSVIVFFCSFIPVAGVFISSIPICLIALQAAGLETMLLAIGMIIVIHLIEGYILNPKIYGSHMRINPIIVLIILTIGGKLFHFWGLILGVPVCTYFFAHAIRKKTDPDKEKILTGPVAPAQTNAEEGHQPL
jgi:predicted PurR-regulated permease PerM